MFTPSGGGGGIPEEDHSAYESSDYLLAPSYYLHRTDAKFDGTHRKRRRREDDEDERVAHFLRNGRRKEFVLFFLAMARKFLIIIPFSNGRTHSDQDDGTDLQQTKRNARRHLPWIPESPLEWKPLPQCIASAANRSEELQGWSRARSRRERPTRHQQSERQEFCGTPLELIHPKVKLKKMENGGQPSRSGQKEPNETGKGHRIPYRYPFPQTATTLGLGSEGL